jgi:hypothetical protein
MVHAAKSRKRRKKRQTATISASNPYCVADIRKCCRRVTFPNDLPKNADQKEVIKQSAFSAANTIEIAAPA